MGHGVVWALEWCSIYRGIVIIQLQSLGGTSNGAQRIVGAKEKKVIYFYVCYYYGRHQILYLEGICLCLQKIDPQADWLSGLTVTIAEADWL